MNIIPFQREEERLFQKYLDHLCQDKKERTASDYGYIVKSFIQWLADRPMNEGRFRPEMISTAAVEMFLNRKRTVKDQVTGEEREVEYGISTKNKMRAALSHFCSWLMDQGLLDKNPTRGVEIPPQPLMAPRVMTDDQRLVLRTLVEKKGDLRSQAIFALGYWAGCRVSDVSWLKISDTHLTTKSGWLRVGHKGGKQREIDLLNQVRRPLYDYLQERLRDGRHKDSEFVFTSQRSDRLTEAGIHHWLRNLKEKATRGEWELIHDITFHDFRHDFAHRCREAGWTLEEIAYYLGHITKKGEPAIQTTARYTQVSREQIKAKLKLLR